MADLSIFNKFNRILKDQTDLPVCIWDIILMTSGLGNLWRTPMAWPLAYLWHTYIVGNGNINFVTPLSLVVLTSYLAWCLFRIIDIGHIPHCYGN